MSPDGDCLLAPRIRQPPSARHRRNAAEPPAPASPAKINALSANRPADDAAWPKAGNLRKVKALQGHGAAVMFLHHLDETQKRGLFALAARMIAADKVISESEVDYLNALIGESGLAGDNPLRGKGKPVDFSIFDSRKAQLAVAMELLILANTDRHYDVNELILWDDILAKFDFTRVEQEHLRANAEIAALLIKNVDDLIASEADADGPSDEDRRAADRRRLDRRRMSRRDTG